MSKKIYYKEEANKKLFEGVEILHSAVSPTLGPKGKCAIISHYGPDGLRKYIVTKDGVTVAQALEDDDQVVNTSIQMVKEAAKKMDALGDGTTTVTVLVYSIIKKAYDLPYFERVVFMKECAGYFKKIIEILKKESEPVTLKNIGKIAKISGNNDETVEQLFNEAYGIVGLNGYIKVAESLTDESYVEVIPGYAADMQLFDNRYSNTPTTGTFLSGSAYVLLYNKEFIDLDEFKEILKDIAKITEPLIIIAKDFSIEIQNRVAQLRGRIALVRNQLRNEENKAILDDISEITGADVVTVYKPMEPVFGKCKRVEITKGHIVFYDLPKMKKYVDNLKEAFKNEKNTGQKEFLQKRITRLTSGLVTMYIGSKSDIAKDEFRDRINDALGATKNSVKMGYIPGGGQLLIKASHRIKKEYTYGNSFHKILCAPYIKMMENADYEEKKIEQEVKFIETSIYFTNLLKEEAETKEEFEVIDPLVIVVSALEISLSIATTFTQTQTLIVEL